MGNRNKKNTIKDLFYPILGTFIISLSIYLFTLTTGVWSKDYTPEVLSFRQHEIIDRFIEMKEKFVTWEEVVPEAPKAPLVTLAEKKGRTSKLKERI